MSTLAMVGWVLLGGAIVNVATWSYSAWQDRRRSYKPRTPRRLGLTLGDDAAALRRAQRRSEPRGVE